MKKLALKICPMSLSEKLDRINVFPHFQPCEIVCLECDRSLLYAEVVQTVEERQVCWVHPLALTISSLNHLSDEKAVDPVCYDLREGADLLLPVVLFRSAFDVEVIPLIAHLYNSDLEDCSSWQREMARTEVNHFIKRLCQTHPEAF